MPRLFQKRSGTWLEILSIFQKQGGTWTEILNVFQKIGGTWTKVFAGLKVPGNTVAPTITGSGYLFQTLTNTNLGTWTNTPTSYARQWRRGTPSGGGGLPSGYSNISGATSSTYTTVSADNGKYVVCQVTATNAVGSNAAASDVIYVKKYDPVSLLPYTFSGSTVVGGTLTANEQGGSWKQTTTNSGDTSPDTFEYEWSYTDGTIIQSSTLSFASYPRNINSSSLLIINADLNKQIRVRVIGTNSGDSATSNYTTSATVTTTYVFAFGNTLYVGSNGYITLDQAPSSAIAALPAGNGRTINIWNEDLVQYRLQEYSDNSNYYLYFRSYRYLNPLVQSAINALDYQIKFYTGQPYCDVYLVRKGSSVPAYINTPGYYSNGLFETPGFSGAWVTGSVARIYLGTSAATSSNIPWTAISNTLWKDITTSQIDDGFTAVVTSGNQQNVITPTITMLSNSGVGPSSGTINWTSTNQESFSSSGTISGSGSTGTSVTNNTLSAGTTYSGTVTVTSSTGHTASANYSLTTSASTFTMPNIVGMTRTAGGNAIVAAGFYYENDYPYTTNDINLDQIIFAQTPAAGFVGVPQNAYFDYYNYVAPNITYGACTAYGSPYYSNSTYECSGNYSYYYTDNYYYQRKQILSNGTWNGSYDYDCPTTSVRTYGNFIQVNGQCGYSAPAPSPTITSGPFISWGSGNNFTLSATASNATNIEFQVQFGNNEGGPVLSTQTFFMGASAGSRTTGAQQYDWARTRARANNSTTNLSSAFSGYTAWA